MKHLIALALLAAVALCTAAPIAVASVTNQFHVN